MSLFDWLPFMQSKYLFQAKLAGRTYKVSKASDSLFNNQKMQQFNARRLQDAYELFMNALAATEELEKGIRGGRSFTIDEIGTVLDNLDNHTTELQKELQIAETMRDFLATQASETSDIKVRRMRVIDSEEVNDLCHVLEKLIVGGTSELLAVRRLVRPKRA